MPGDDDAASHSPSPGARRRYRTGHDLDWRPGEMGDLRAGPNHSGAAWIHCRGLSGLGLWIPSGTMRMTSPRSSASNQASVYQLLAEKFIASIIRVAVQHSKTENRDILPE